MRNLVTLICAISSLSLANLAVAAEPRGNVLELHSCELYAGGCIVSSEATLDGRQMLRVWNFTGGSFAGSDFSGLQVAVVQSASENLAAPNTRSAEGVAYLPENATAAQRKALLAWLKSSQADLASALLKSRTVSLQSAKTDTGYTFTAGKFVSVKTASLESCQTGMCGESLWYSPRAETSVFTVAVDRASRVTEPLLRLQWNDGGTRSIFLGKFGDGNPAKNLYVSSSDLCGPADKLF